MMGTNNITQGWVSEPSLGFSRDLEHPLHLPLHRVRLHLERAASRLYPTRLLVDQQAYPKVQSMVVAMLAPKYITLTALAQRSSTVAALSDK